MDRKSFLFSLSFVGLGLGLKAKDLRLIKKAEVTKIGIIGLDSTHAIAFTKAINGDSKHSGFEVVAAYPFGSNSITLSKERIPKFTTEIQQLGVAITSSIAELLKEVDCVLLETNDGNLHVSQALEVIRAGKPLFIDKPIANSYEDARRIFEEADKHGCPVFSSSSLRYIEGLDTLDKSQIIGADVYSPAHKEPSHKDLYWYGIHGVEMLFALLGPDCKSVQTIEENGTSIYVGTWSDGRCGTLRGIRMGKEDFGGTVFLNDTIVRLGAFKGYQPLLDKILLFFKTKVSPVPKEETLAICAFIDGAERSKRKKGKVIYLQGNTLKVGLRSIS